MAGGYSLWEWLTGVPLVNAAGNAAGQGAPVQYGPAADPKTHQIVNTRTGERLTGDSLTAENIQRMKQWNTAAQQQNADKQRQSDAYWESASALEHPPGQNYQYRGELPPVVTPQTYQGGRDPFQPLPGMQHNPDPNADPFVKKKGKGGASSGSGGGGQMGIGGGNPQQMMGAPQVNPLMLLLAQMMMGAQQTQQPMMGFGAPQQPQPSLGWFNIPFTAPPQMMGGGGGGGQTGGQGGAAAGGGDPAANPPVNYISKGQDPSSDDWGSNTPFQESYNWNGIQFNGVEMNPQQALKSQYIQDQAANRPHNISPGRQLQAEQSLRQKRDKAKEKK